MNPSNPILNGPLWIPGPWRAQRMANGDWFIRPVANRGEPVVGSGWDEAHAQLMAAAPQMAAYIQRRAEAGDQEAADLWRLANGSGSESLDGRDTAAVPMIAITNPQYGEYLATHPIKARGE